MAKIFYSMAGEGRGHATRVRAVVEALRQQHDITLFAPAAAYEFLAQIYAETKVAVRRIPALLFHYHGTRMSYWKTGLQAARYVCGLPRLVNRLSRIVQAEQPHLVITDFEPALPRAALRCQVPFISLDHQHFLTTSDLSMLPSKLQWHAWAMWQAVRSYYQGQSETVVSSFYFPPLKSGCRSVVQTGVLLRPQIEQATPRVGDHVLVYLRRPLGQHLIQTLSQCTREVRVYGLGALPAAGRLRFLPVNEAGFLKDLVTCHALVSTCGNQLIGEAFSLGKPVLALPEPQQFEQHINAHFLRASGGGDWVPPEDFNLQVLQRFLDRRNEYCSQLDPAALNGNRLALAAIQRHLPVSRDAESLNLSAELSKGAA